MLNHIKKVLNSIGLALQDVLLVVPMLTMYSAYLIQLHKLRDRIARIVAEQEDWEAYADDSLGIRFIIPASMHVTHTTDPVHPDTIIITDMQLTQHEEPVKESMLYRPKYGGEGGGYESNEEPIYKGIMIMINRNSVRNSQKKTNLHEIMFKKYWYEGKNVNETILIGENTYQVTASYLNIPEYDMLYKAVKHSIGPS